ncbi:MAG: hypothetical protein GY773_00910 [Actinomycetia bacterium]|nr:hypothetical protein [Actinomycetes bacterium]
MTNNTSPKLAAFREAWHHPECGSASPARASMLSREAATRFEGTHEQRAEFHRQFLHTIRYGVNR